MCQRSTDPVHEEGLSLHDMLFLVKLCRGMPGAGSDPVLIEDITKYSCMPFRSRDIVKQTDRVRLLAHAPRLHSLEIRVHVDASLFIPKVLVHSLLYTIRQLVVAL